MMFGSIFRIMALVRKELLAMLKDPRGRAVLFIPPALQCLVFGYVVSFDLNQIPYAAFDRDRSGASYEMLAAFDGSGVFQRIANLERADDVKTVVDDRRALLVIQIDQDFERKLLSAQSADVQVIADGRNSNTAGTAMTYARTVVDAFNTQWRETHGGTGPPLRAISRAWYNWNLETRWSIVPSLIGTLTLAEMLLLTAMSIAREKEQGTFDQLLVTPFRPAEIMTGKALPSLFVGLSQSTVILLVAQLWFRIPFAGSFVTLYIGITLFLLAAAGIGLLVSSLVTTMQQALLASFLLVMPFTLLSGLLTPLSSMPEALQQFSRLNPLRYMIDMAQRVYLEGAGVDRLASDLLPLAATAVLTLSIGSFVFRRRLG
jgi:ABC-2 type transport system permease protein